MRKLPSPPRAPQSPWIALACVHSVVVVPGRCYTSQWQQHRHLRSGWSPPALWHRCVSAGNPSLDGMALSQCTGRFETRAKRWRMHTRKAGPPWLAVVARQRRGCRMPIPGRRARAGGSIMLQDVSDRGADIINEMLRFSMDVLKASSVALTWIEQTDGQPGSVDSATTCR